MVPQIQADHSHYRRDFGKSELKLKSVEVNRSFTTEGTDEECDNELWVKVHIRSQF